MKWFLFASVAALALLAPDAHAQTSAHLAAPRAEVSPPVGPEPPPDLSYHDGDPVPAGYHVVERRVPRLAQAGFSLFAVGYTLPVFYAGLIDFFSNAASGHRETKLDALFIPVVGPIVAGNTNHASQRTWSLIWTDVAFQGAGVAVLLGGVIYHKPILVKDGIALAGVVPVASGDASTLVLAGTF